MSRKKIVLSINTSWNVYNFRLGLIRGLRARGHDVTVLAPHDAYSAKLEELGIAYVPISMDKKGVSPLQDLRLVLRYWQALKRLRPDVFLGYTAKPNIYGSLAAQALGVRVINNVSGLGTAFIRQGMLTWIVSALYRLAFRRSATVFFQNEEDRDLFVGRGLAARDRTRLLPGSGIDLERFKPAPPAPAGLGFTFLLVARLLRDKGIGEYIEAARQVRRTHPQTRFQLLGFLDVANRSAVSRAEVAQWISEGIADYLGESDDVRPFVAAADCIVLPSYREGLPRSLLEGAAMGKPLIATNVPGCRHIVSAGVNGLLCEARDSDSLARTMVEMLEAPLEQRSRWGAAGRARVEREFDENIALTQYLDAIDRAFA